MLLLPFGNKKGPARLSAGGLIVEILIVIAIISLALMGLSGLVSFSLDASRVSGQNVQAEVLAQEAMEAVRNFRDSASWSVGGLGALATSTDYYPRATGSPGYWELIQGQETLAGFFTRKIIFSDVQRDGNGDIAVAGGAVDPETRKVDVSVSWQEKGRPHQLSVSTYFTNWNK